ncbi:hypothetical protein CDL12_08418 [Handroanthus impetiginosus]|uniref:DM2 domain-containing protein n=1 Tax=Handroanthus impetiginosus TaxID=429701 RepID=A0A2G9HN00_9LAMI|nr:hypothetical protein CDL12_08418 [Handroanthus impetiginosus]
MQCMDVFLAESGKFLGFVENHSFRDKLKVYLAPFLHGMRYTSFGRHFTKPDKLKEIVDLLHWYVRDGDMVVDFCCGSNDFSCLMKKKLDEMGKSCSFKNYDILQAKNDFNFERRDWMGVRPNELLDGSKLIMGLNPPFGVNAALANRFINKALEFKPKLLILIVPRETERLDEKESPYDLIWEYEQMFVGKSFYLPGSVDVNDQQIEDWNVNGPSLYLWSNPAWTPKHKAIAEQHGHLGGQRSHRLEDSHNEMLNANSSQECHNLDKSIANQGEDTHRDKPDNVEPEDRMTPSSHQEDLTRDSGGTDKDENHAKGKNHSEENSKKTRRKRKKKRQSGNMFVEDKFSRKRHVSRHPSRQLSPSPKETYPPKYLAGPSHMHVHSGRDDHQRNLSNHQLFSQTGYNANQATDVRSYRLNGEEPCPSTASRQAYAPSPNHPDYGFRGPTEQWMGPHEGRANSIGYNSSYTEMNEEYERGAIIPSRVNVHGREELNYFSQRSICPSYPEPIPYGQLNPVANSSYTGMNHTSVIQRYAARLDEVDHGRMVTVPPVQDAGGFYPQDPRLRYPPRPGFPVAPFGFAARPFRPFPPNNSSGWLNE